MKERTEEASSKHEALYQEVIAVIRKYSDEMDSAEVLAVLANMTGKVLAMQDQRKYSPQAAMAIVSRNIELGNRQVLTELMKSEGQA
jgi:septum formation topological specificity factor MinE